MAANRSSQLNKPIQRTGRLPQASAGALIGRSCIIIEQVSTVLPQAGPGNLAPHTIDQLAAAARTRLKQMQYRSRLLDGFIAETALTPGLP